MTDKQLALVLILLVCVFLILLVCAFFAGVLLRSPVKRLLKRCVEHLSLIKQYWLFVIPFLIVVALLYYLTFTQVPDNRQKVFFMILGQLSALTFAIFIGYFAFMQVVVNRMESLQRTADGYVQQRRYRRAIAHYEQMLKIDPRHLHALHNVLELYLMVEDRRQFDIHIDRLAQTTVEYVENIIYYYLITTRHLLEENVGVARDRINELVRIVKLHPESLAHFHWSFSEMEGSNTYMNLKNESKKMLENFIKYLSRKLNATEKSKFEDGNFSLLS